MLRKARTAVPPPRRAPQPASGALYPARVAVECPRSQGSRPGTGPGMTWRRRFIRTRVPGTNHRPRNPIVPTVAGERDRHERPCSRANRNVAQRRGVTKRFSEVVHERGRTCIISDDRGTSGASFPGARDALANMDCVRTRDPQPIENVMWNWPIAVSQSRRPGSSQSRHSRRRQAGTSLRSRRRQRVEPTRRDGPLRHTKLPSNGSPQLRDPSSASRGTPCWLTRKHCRGGNFEMFCQIERGAGM